MARRKRPEQAPQARRINLEQLARIGGQVAASRKRRGWSQTALALKVGLSQSSVSIIELGHGGQLSLDAWQRVGLALDRPLRIELARDSREEPADAGHLGIQELVMRSGRTAGFWATFELPTRPSNPAHSTDVGLRDDRGRRLILIECWNTIGDIGAAMRSTNRKRADAEGLAAVIGGSRPVGSSGPGGAVRVGPTDEPGEPYAVATCWVIRATRRNQELVRRYPELFASRFPGSSRQWVHALTFGGSVPADLGLVWCDVRATRLYAWRQ